MKKASIMTLILVLTATLFAGCRNMGGNPGNTTTPMGSSLPTQTVAPMPELPMPTASNTTPGGTNATIGDATDPGTSGITGRAMRPSARGPRY